MLKHQKKVNKFIEENKIKTKVEFRVLDLLSEAGELSKEFLKATDYGKEEFIPTKDWKIELGDLYFCLLSLANSSQVDLDEVLKKVFEKYENRIEKTGKPSSLEKVTE